MFRTHALALILLLTTPLTAAEPNTRPAHCAGGWYPGDRQELAATVDELLTKATPPAITAKPRAVIAPHAGYRFSAPTAAAGYAALKGHSYRRAVVLAFSHRSAASYTGVDVPKDLSAYQTPLGPVLIDRDACDQLLAHPGFKHHSGIDSGEHSLELQLPFLQRTLGTDFKLVPLLVGRMTDEHCAELAQAILPLIDNETILVASTDFTHYGPNFGYRPFNDDVPEKIRELADAAAVSIIRADYDGFVAHLAKTNDTICGRDPVRLLLRLLSMMGGAQGFRAKYDTSGRMLNDWVNSVTYQSFVFTRPTGTLQPDEQAILLRLARETVTAHLSGREPPQPDPATLPQALRNDGACFVTLQNHGRLRGCIGNMQATDPLYQAVIRNAVSACGDYRFRDNPVTAKELAEIDLEISYLTPMKRVVDPSEIIVGRHGLLLGLRGRRGVLLPQVAYERGWTREQFLDQTCNKAGLPAGAWKLPDAETYSYTAEVFGEHE